MCNEHGLHKLKWTERTCVDIATVWDVRVFIVLITRFNTSNHTQLLCDLFPHIHLSIVSYK